MSLEVELVRRAYEALNAGNIDELVALCDPDFRLDMSDRVFNPATYQGEEGIRRFYDEVREVWESFVWEPEQLFERGEVIVALLHARGRGRGSALEIDRRTAMLWTVRGDRCLSLIFYGDRDRALEAAERTRDDAGLA
jgi:ketosteroid isomerase-like protein